MLSMIFWPFRHGAHLGLGNGEDLPVVGESVLGDRQLDDVEHLLEAGRGLLHVDAQCSVLPSADAPADAQLRSARSSPITS